MPTQYARAGDERLRAEDEALERVRAERISHLGRLPRLGVQHRLPRLRVQDGAGLGDRRLVAEDADAGQRAVHDVELQREREGKPHGRRDDEEAHHDLARAQLAQRQEKQSGHRAGVSVSASAGASAGMSGWVTTSTKRSSSDCRSGSTDSSSTPAARSASSASLRCARSGSVRT